MSLKVYLWGLRISTFLSLVAWILILNNIDPEGAGNVGKALFYFSLFLFLTGIFTLMFTWVMRIFSDHELLLFQLGASFRQGALLALLVIILLIMQNKQVLVWWDGLLVVAGIFLIELYFLKKQHKEG